MEWGKQIIVFGLIALVFFIGSQLCASLKKYFLGAIFGILELASAVVSSYAWAWALKVSGKGDWFLLGILGYPPIGLIFWAMFVVGVMSLVKNGKGLAQKRKSADTAAQA